MLIYIKLDGFQIYFSMPRVCSLNSSPIYPTSYLTISRWFERQIRISVIQYPSLSSWYLPPNLFLPNINGYLPFWLLQLQILLSFLSPLFPLHPHIQSICKSCWLYFQIYWESDNLPLFYCYHTCTKHYLLLSELLKTSSNQSPCFLSSDCSQHSSQSDPVKTYPSPIKTPFSYLEQTPKTWLWTTRSCVICPLHHYIQISSSALPVSPSASATSAPISGPFYLLFVLPYMPSP